ncbi:fibrillin-1-like [Lingula anatina]|uniref:Fibrillin-1-like n=1 Tax=Lingula anatina TaxID=7574 RepID=A0A1S3JY39_LINAN|nr:fibrillin-1-like [Lingula anatina]|eukprot:XP_013415298.1 fibrillin-1-like [Lingula anatina]
MPLRMILAVTGIFTTVLLSYFGVSSGLTGHVCNRTEERNFTRSVLQYRYCRYYRSCGFWGWSRCARYYSCSTYSLEYDSFNVTVQYCCEGWSAGANATNTSSCDIPVCAEGCENNGECIAPDTCKCQPPYHGPTCNETYDPCQINTELAVGYERSTNNTNFTADPKCDSTLLRTWYEIGHSAIFHMPTTCPGSPACGTTGPVWVNTTNTSIQAGAMVTLEACVGSPDSCCESLLPVQIKNCTDFMVYYLSPTVTCPQAYCFEVAPCVDCNKTVCPDGYQYDFKAASCKDINECAVNNGGCSDICSNTIGSYHCECNEADFMLGCDVHTCQVFDPCQINTELTVGFERSTNNTNFTADPKCDSTLLRTWYKIGHSAIFHLPTTCPGSPACGTTGPIWVNTTNTSVPADAMVTLEACVGSTDSCCESLLPVQIKNCTEFMVYYLSPTVECPQAYCFEVTPCVDCNKTVCPDGYRYDSKTADCEDINECALNNGCCSDICINTNGSYHCKCKEAGFSLGIDGQTCQDIDECAVNNGNCSDVCSNTIGSYHCECTEAGFLLAGDGQTCQGL